jgi:uncharacterized protein (TIGR04222 family)
MTNPYREPGRRPARRRRPRAAQLALYVAVLWALGVSRLVFAIERDEPVSAEPALAALLTVVPPIALLFRSARDMMAPELEAERNEAEARESSTPGSSA